MVRDSGLLVAEVVELLLQPRLLVRVEVLVDHMQEVVGDLLLHHEIHQHLMDLKTLVEAVPVGVEL
jgi:hypothetical protein